MFETSYFEISAYSNFRIICSYQYSYPCVISLSSTLQPTFLPSPYMHVSKVYLLVNCIKSFKIIRKWYIKGIVIYISHIYYEL